jgi:GNAT superfamily N-acetyltransferase
MMTIDRADMDEAGIVAGLLNGARAWLHATGLEQWPNEFTRESVTRMMVRGGVWIVRDGDRPVATVTLTPEADPAFWNSAEAEAPAMYVSGLAVASPGQHSGLGELVLRWAGDYALQLGYPMLRLDARRDNPGLHEYYARRGWRYIRTVAAPGRFSGALFDKPADSDAEARAALPPLTVHHGWFDEGTPVTVAGRGPGVVLTIEPGWSEYGSDLQVDDPGGLTRIPGYMVRLESGELVSVGRSEVSAQP